MKFIERHATATIKRLSREFPACLVTGARQTGKTTILQKMKTNKSTQYLTFDDPLEEVSAKSDPKAFLELHPSPYIFDEIQYVPELFRFLKINIDSNRKNGMYYFTGSQQFNLIEKATESLAGRIGILELYPLSAREIRKDKFDKPFLPSKKYISQRAKALSDVEPSVYKTWKAIFSGGYPEVVKGKINTNDFYGNYLKTYIERDIRKITQITDEMQFLQFITVVASRTGQLVNYGDLGKEVGISEVTAKKWLSLLIASGLVYLLKPFSINVEKRIIKTPKLYFMDTGLAAYLTRWTSPEVMRTGAMAGAFFETYVVSEIIKSFANQGIEAPVYFYRDKDKIEIDLMIYQDNTLYPIEIKKTATPNSEDAKNFYITNRIKNMQIETGTIICNCSKPVAISPEVFALPVEFI